MATADIFELHSRPEYANATFMAASQLNGLALSHPEALPEDGITGYAFDPTQGAACALAAPAATVARNYFLPVLGQVGQSKDRQLNFISNLLGRLQLPTEQLVAVRNGYAFVQNEDDLQTINARIAAARSRDELLACVHVGAAPSSWLCLSTVSGREGCEVVGVDEAAGCLKQSANVCFSHACAVHLIT